MFDHATFLPKILIRVPQDKVQIPSQDVYNLLWSGQSLPYQPLASSLSVLYLTVYPQATQIICSS